VIDIHSHILPDIDDGAETWEEALQMARLAVADGIRIMVASPHLFRKRTNNQWEINHKEDILAKIEEFNQKLQAEGLELEILPGCDFPLSFEGLQLLDDDQVLTINDAKRYLLLEFPYSALPPASEDICFRLLSKGLTPIITHPERHLVLQEMPKKLRRFLDLGCLAQLTANSLTGGFGRRVAQVSREMLAQGYIQVLASDCHNPRKRPPLLQQAIKMAATVVGKERAQALVNGNPEKIVKGQPCC
jgi:protein-tyrosine phosphatase